MFDAEKVKDSCVQWIRDFFEENGKGCNAVVGISGGKDSSVVAALCVEALGRDRVIGVLMPNGQQHDIDVSLIMLYVREADLRPGTFFQVTHAAFPLCRKPGRAVSALRQGSVKPDGRQIDRRVKAVLLALLFDPVA